MSNFNTLVTVAAAQTPTVSPRSITSNSQTTPHHIAQHHHPHPSKKINNMTTTTSNQIETTLSNNNNQIKIPMNLSQINTSISNHDQFNANIIPSNISKQQLSTITNNSSSSSSTNTIRNLLALNTPASIANNTNQNNKINNNNIRLSAGVGTLLSQQSQQQLIDINTHNSVSINNKKPTHLNHNQDVHSSQPVVSSLLSVILAPTAIQIENNIKNNNNSKLIINEDNDHVNPTKSANKRGRKSIAKSNKNDLSTQQQDVYMRNESLVSNVPNLNHHPIVMDIDPPSDTNLKETSRKKKNNIINSNNLTFQTNNNYNHQII